MDIAVRHALVYNTRKDVPVHVVAESLLANERLLIESIRIIEKLTPGLDVQSISVRVAELSNSSPLRETLIAALVVTYQTELVKEVPELIQILTGYHVPEKFSTLVTILVLATVFYIISTAAERLLPGKALKKLMEEYQQKISRVSELSGIPKETIEKYASQCVKQDETLLKKALQFLAPAKLEPGANILLPDSSVVSADAIQEVPEEFVFFEPEKVSQYELRGVVIDIHRSDRDEKKHGWRAVVPSVCESKVRMELAPGIDPESLWGRKTIVGNIVVSDEVFFDGTSKPTVYHLMSVRDESQQD